MALEFSKTDFWAKFKKKKINNFDSTGELKICKLKKKNSMNQNFYKTL